MNNVVAAVLVILIVVAAVSLVWTFIIPMIGDDFGESGGNVLIVTSEGYTVYDSKTELVSVQVARRGGGSELKSIDFVFSVEGESVIFTVPKGNVLERNSRELYKFNFEGRGQPESVRIVPLFEVGSGSVTGEVVASGEVVGDVKLKEGSVDRNGIIYDLIEDGDGTVYGLVVPDPESSSGCGFCLGETPSTFSWDWYGHSSTGSGNGPMVRSSTNPCKWEFGTVPLGGSSSSDYIPMTLEIVNGEIVWNVRGVDIYYSNWPVYFSGPIDCCAKIPGDQSSEWVVGDCSSSCEDEDGDGYGNPGDSSCARGGQEDCVDKRADCSRYGFDRLACEMFCDDLLEGGSWLINPGATENCSNGVDDDCDGKIDCVDVDCKNKKCETFVNDVCGVCVDSKDATGYSAICTSNSVPKLDVSDKIKVIEYNETTGKELYREKKYYEDRKFYKVGKNTFLQDKSYFAIPISDEHFRGLGWQAFPELPDAKRIETSFGNLYLEYIFESLGSFGVGLPGVVFDGMFGGVCESPSGEDTGNRCLVGWRPNYSMYELPKRMVRGFLRVTDDGIVSEDSSNSPCLGENKLNLTERFDMIVCPSVVENFYEGNITKEIEIKTRFPFIGEKDVFPGDGDVKATINLEFGKIDYESDSCMPENVKTYLKIEGRAKVGTARIGQSEFMYKYGDRLASDCSLPDKLRGIGFLCSILGRLPLPRLGYYDSVVAGREEVMKESGFYYLARSERLLSKDGFEEDLRRFMNRYYDTSTKADGWVTNEVWITMNSDMKGTAREKVSIEVDYEDRFGDNRTDNEVIHDRTINVDFFDTRGMELSFVVSFFKTFTNGEKTYPRVPKKAAREFLKNFPSEDESEWQGLSGGGGSGVEFKKIVKTGVNGRREFVKFSDFNYYCCYGLNRRGIKITEDYIRSSEIMTRHSEWIEDIYNRGMLWVPSMESTYVIRDMNNLDLHGTGYVVESSVEPLNNTLKAFDISAFVNDITWCSGADLDEDGDVDSDDDAVLLDNLGRSGDDIVDGDVNGDGVVNFDDYVLFFENLGRTGCGGGPDTTWCSGSDFDEDGDVDVNDNSVLMSNFGGFGEGDLNEDGAVDILDFSVLRENLGRTDCGGELDTTWCSGADLDEDGSVDGDDYSVLLGNFGGSGEGDLNEDGVVDFSDFAVFRVNNERTDCGGEVVEVYDILVLDTEELEGLCNVSTVESEVFSLSAHEERIIDWDGGLMSIVVPNESYGEDTELTLRKIEISDCNYSSVEEMMDALPGRFNYEDFGDEAPLFNLSFGVTEEMPYAAFIYWLSDMIDVEETVSLVAGYITGLDVVFYSGADSTITVGRELPESVNIDEEFVVYLDVDFEGSGSSDLFGIEETIPRGWEFVSSEPEDFIFNNVSNEIKWVWGPEELEMFEPMEMRIEYVVKPISEFNEFVGSWALSRAEVVESGVVVGDSQTNVEVSIFDSIMGFFGDVVDFLNPF